MTQLKTYHLFISHAWKYDKHYTHLIEMLKHAPDFYFKNYSLPKHNHKLDPTMLTDQTALTHELIEQIRPVHCVLVLAGMYTAHSFWIQKEIELAQELHKPLIGIKPRGQQRIPLILTCRANVLVGWHTPSIVKAIRTFAQQSDT